MTPADLRDLTWEKLQPLLAGHRLTADNIVLIDSREYRTQAQNREAAHERLIELVTKAAIRPKKRTATKPKKAAKEKRLVGKKIVRNARGDDVWEFEGQKIPNIGLNAVAGRPK